MSLNKAILHRKEKRKMYRGAKDADRSCRNHGGCPYCEGNRKHKFRDKHVVSPAELEEEIERALTEKDSWSNDRSAFFIAQKYI